MALGLIDQAEPRGGGAQFLAEREGLFRSERKPAFEAVQALVSAAHGRHLGLAVEHGQDGQIVPVADLIVHRVVAGDEAQA